MNEQTSTGAPRLEEYAGLLALVKALEYHEHERLQPVVGEIAWSHNLAIILCKEKSRTIVEYALHDARKPIGVATYEITRTLPKDLAGQLPNPEEITALLDGIEI